METIDDALEILDKSIESKEIDVFLIGVANLQEGTTRVSYKHGDDVVTHSGGHLLNLIMHIMRIVAESNDLNKKELYNALIDLLDNDLIEN